jgi:hypothetical protein
MMNAVLEIIAINALAGGVFNSEKTPEWPSLSVLERVGHSFLFSPCRVAGVRIDPESWSRFSSSLFSGHSTFNL